MGIAQRPVAMSEIKAWLYDRGDGEPWVLLDKADYLAERGYTEEPLVTLSLLQEALEALKEAADDLNGEGILDGTLAEKVAALLQKAERLSRIDEVE